MYCTRSYAVGANTTTVSKASLRPSRRRWDEVFAYIAATPALQDIVVSGGDAYYLQPDQLRLIGEKLISIPHIKRFRFASKGLAVAPGRVLEGPGEGDGWIEALIEVSDKARRAGKMMAWHTHFNHPQEMSWVSELACKRLFEAGVTVRNQSVLLRGVNDDLETMGGLIRRLADNCVVPVSWLLQFCCSFSYSPYSATGFPLPLFYSPFPTPPFPLPFSTLPFLTLPFSPPSPLFTSD